MGGYAEGNNHRTFYEKNPDNSVITVPPRGYGNDVLKYIEEHKMLTKDKISENTKQEEYQHEALNISIPRYNESSSESIIDSNNESPSSTYNPPYYEMANDDEFSGYRLQDDEYFEW